MTTESLSNKAAVEEQVLAISLLEAAVGREMRRERWKTTVLQGAAALSLFGAVFLIVATRLSPA